MQIKIGPFIYELRVVHNLVTPERDQTLDGHIKHDEAAILVDDSLAPQKQRQVIWHEIIHGILNQSYVNEHDERLINVLSYGIMGVLQDNEWLREPPIQTNQTKE